MDISKNLAEVLENAENAANKLGTENFTTTHIEYALVRTSGSYTKPFIDVLGKSTYDELVNRLTESLKTQPKINKATIDKYRSMDKDLPIRRDRDVLVVIRTSQIVAMSRWITGDIELSHLFLALMSNDSGNSVLLDFFHEYDVTGEQVEAIFEGLAKLESEDYDLPLNTEIVENTEPTFAGQSGEGQVDWHDYVTDLVEQVKDYKKPFIGRDEIIESTLRTLCRMDKSNPVLVGEPGVGKTAITKGVAKKISEGDVPDKLKGAKFYSVDLAGMVAGSKYRGEFEEKLKSLLKGVLEESSNVILFFDELHTIVGAGATGSGSMDASNIIKPYLTEGKIKFIGATTYDEYRQYIEKDKALERRFQKIDVEEPSIKDTIEILNGLKSAYEDYHKVKYSKSVIDKAVNLSVKYINDRFLPDKAIDLIDEAGAIHAVHPELGKKITVDDIETIVSKLCHIPKITAENDDIVQVRNLDKKIKSKVFGQEQAINAIVESIKLSKSGLGDDEKPIGSFLLVGPSGVGKTEVAKQLAKNLKIDFVRFDMSEYQEKHTVAKLIGAPAGYIGYEDGGLLTEAVRKAPHCVLLFDEIEKAHPDIYKTFLQVMDYGTLTDNRGRQANFKNCIIIMTSNAGATVAAKKNIGFTPSTALNGVNVSGINEAVEKTFSPEFRNRLTKMVVFNGINDEIGKMVVKKELNELVLKLKIKKINAKFTENCINELVLEGVSPVYGARGVQRCVNENVKKLFVDAIIEGTKLTDCVVDYDGKTFCINKTKTKKTKTETV